MTVISTSNEKDSDKYIHGRYLNFQWLGIENWETTANSNKIVTLLHKQNKYKLTLIPIGVSRSSTRAESFWSTISCIHTSLSRLTFLPAYMTSDEEIYITSCQMVKKRNLQQGNGALQAPPPAPIVWWTLRHLPSSTTWCKQYNAAGDVYLYTTMMQCSNTSTLHITKLPEKDRVMDISNMHKKFGEDQTYSSARYAPSTDRQTDR